jgi:hypothetical protein
MNYERGFPGRNPCELKNLMNDEKKISTEI